MFQFPHRHETIFPAGTDLGVTYAPNPKYHCCLVSCCTKALECRGRAQGHAAFRWLKDQKKGCGIDRKRQIITLVQTAIESNITRHMMFEVQNIVKWNEDFFFSFVGQRWLRLIVCPSFIKFQKKTSSFLWECGRWSVLWTEHDNNSWPRGLFWKQLCDCTTWAADSVKQIEQRWNVARFHSEIGPQALCHQSPQLCGVFNAR